MTKIDQIVETIVTLDGRPTSYRQLSEQLAIHPQYAVDAIHLLLRRKRIVRVSTGRVGSVYRVAQQEVA